MLRLVVAAKYLIPGTSKGGGVHNEKGELRHVRGVRTTDIMAPPVLHRDMISNPFKRFKAPDTRRHLSSETLHHEVHGVFS